MFFRKKQSLYYKKNIATTEEKSYKMKQFNRKIKIKKEQFIA